MIGLILAGGSGSRLYPLTQVTSKQLLTVYDKPMIYYPLTTLIEAGIRDICLISNPGSLPGYERLFGDGSRLGLTVKYVAQNKPNGIAEAFILAEHLIGIKDDVALILGDNIFHGDSGMAGLHFQSGAMIFAYEVKDPERYGVVEFDERGEVISIKEKPANPASPYAIPGLYVFDSEVVDIAKAQKPSARGELEITDVIQSYLNRDKLTAHKLPRGFAWLDAGTSSSLHQASAYVQTIEERTGVKIGCPEEAAYRQGFITIKELEEAVNAMAKCEYRSYLERLI